MYKLVSALLLLFVLSASVSACRAKKVDCPAYGKAPISAPSKAA